MPASLMTLLHFAVSLRRKTLNSAGVLPTATAPEATNDFAMSGWRIAAMTSCASLSTILLGVPAGATMPWNASA